MHSSKRKHTFFISLNYSRVLNPSSPFLGENAETTTTTTSFSSSSASSVVIATTEGTDVLKFH